MAQSKTSHPLPTSSKSLGMWPAFGISRLTSERKTGQGHFCDTKLIERVRGRGVRNESKRKRWKQATTNSREGHLQTVQRGTGEELNVEGIDLRKLDECER